MEYGENTENSRMGAVNVSLQYLVSSVHSAHPQVTPCFVCVPSLCDTSVQSLHLSKSSPCICAYAFCLAA